MNNILIELEEAKNKLNNDINNIIEKLNKVKDNYELYYNITIHIGKDHHLKNLPNFHQFK